jgi:hypothetical protein
LPRLDPLCSQSKKPAYFWINYAAAFLHFVNALLMVIFKFANDESMGSYRLLVDRQIWKRPNRTFGEICGGDSTVPTCDYAAGEIDLGGNETWCGVLEQRDVGEISLFWLIFWFHLLSFLFQIIASLQWPLCRYTYSEYVDMGKSPLRWLEYSVSASLMLLSVAVVLGVYNQSALSGIGFLCASCMLCGWISDELKNLPGGRKYAQGAHLLGWFNLLGAYMSILLEFLADLDTDAEIPGFVYAIIGGIFFLFNSFGIVSCVQMRFCKCGGECCRAADKNPRTSTQFNRGIELAFCTLSLVAKTFLGWLLYSNVLAGRDSNRPGTCPPDVGEL